MLETLETWVFLNQVYVFETWKNESKFDDKKIKCRWIGGGLAYEVFCRVEMDKCQAQ